MKNALSSLRSTLVNKNGKILIIKKKNKSKINQKCKKMKEKRHLWLIPIR